MVEEEREIIKDHFYGIRFVVRPRYKYDCTFMHSYELLLFINIIS